MNFCYEVLFCMPTWGAMDCYLGRHWVVALIFVSFLFVLNDFRVLGCYPCGWPSLVQASLNWHLLDKWLLVSSFFRLLLMVVLLLGCWCCCCCCCCCFGCKCSCCWSIWVGNCLSFCFGVGEFVMWLFSITSCLGSDVCFCCVIGGGLLSLVVGPVVSMLLSWLVPMFFVVLPVFSWSWLVL